MDVNTQYFHIAATIGSLCFASNSLAINFIAIPIIQSLKPSETQRISWAVLYNTFSKIMPIFASVGALGSLVVFSRTQDPLFAVTSVLNLFIPAWTLGIMKPRVNDILLSETTKLSEAEVTTLIGQWNKLHFVRSLVGLVSSGLLIFAYFRK